MRLIRFISTHLNGYLDFDPKLNDDINFLLGINGSGKTTVLKAIISILTPDFDWLFGATYKKISLEFEFEDFIYNLSYTKNDEEILILIDSPIYKDNTTIKYLHYRNLKRNSENYSYEEDGEILRLS